MMYRTALCALLFASLTVTVHAATPEVTAQYQAARDLAKAGKTTEAMAAFDAVIKSDPSFAEAYVDRGNAFLNLKKWDDAFGDYTQAIALGEPMPTSPERDGILCRAYLGRAILYSQHKTWAQAIADYDHVIALRPDIDASYNGRAKAYYALNQQDKAEADLRKYAALNGDTDETYLAQAKTASETGDTAGALDDLNRALLLNPRNDRVLALRGDVQQVFAPANAAQDYKLAVNLNPQNAIALCGLATLEMNTGNDKQAKVYLDAALKADPRSSVVYTRLGNFAMSFESGDDRTKDALDSFAKAIQLNPKAESAYFNRGRIYQEQEIFDKALIEYNKAIEINPNDALALNSRGIVYRHLAKYELALADMTRCVNLSPNFSDAYYNRALIYSQMGDSTKALVEINRVRELNPRDSDAKEMMANLISALGVKPDTITTQGDALYATGDYQGAITEYTKALGYDTTAHYARLGRGLAYEHIGETAKAKDDFTLITRYYSNDATAHLQLGELASQENDWTTAAAEFQKTRDLEPNNPSAFCGLANVYRAQKDYNQAWPLYLRAISLRPSFVQAYIDRGQSYLETRQWEKAYSDFDHAVTLDEKNGLAIWKRSFVYYQMGLYDKAESEMQRGRALDASLPDAAYTREQAALNREMWHKRSDTE